MAEVIKSSIILSRQLWVYPLVIFCLVLSIYIWSMPGTVVLEDDGYFILASFFGGYAHPPGYPLYSLLGKLATLFPFGSVASRMHGLSAVIGALACVCLWFFVRLLFRNEMLSQKPVTGELIIKKYLATLAALCYAFSAVFWSQAIIAEVYTLNVLLFLLLSCLVLELRRVGQNNHLLRVCGFICGLSLSNHWPLFVLSTPMLLIFLWSDRRKFIRYFAIASPFMVLGLFPYAWMIYRSHEIPELNFGGPFSTFTDFWRFVSREDFAYVDTSPSAGWNDKAAFSLFVLKETARQFSLPVVLLVLAGFFRQWRYFPLTISVGLLIGFLGNTLLLILLLNFDYDLFHQNTFRVYPVIAYAICAVWLVLGTLFLVGIVSNKLKTINPKFLCAGITVFLIAVVFISNAPANYRANDTRAEDYARVILNSLDKDAVLFANADTINGPVGYLIHVEGFRNDVTLYSGFSIKISNKLYRLYQYHGAELRQLVHSFIDEQKRPIFYTNDFPHDCGFESYGLFFKVDKSNCHDLFLVKIAPRIIKYYTKVALDPEPRDPWELMHYRLLRKDFCYLLINSKGMSGLLSGFGKGDLFYDPYYKLACDHYLGMTSLVDALLSQAISAPENEWVIIEKIIDAAERRRHNEAITKRDNAMLDFLKGEMWFSRNELENALKSYHDAYSLWPHPDNPALVGIENLQGTKTTLQSIKALK